MSSEVLVNHFTHIFLLLQQQLNETKMNPRNLLFQMNPHWTASNISGQIWLKS